MTAAISVSSSPELAAILVKTSLPSWRMRNNTRARLDWPRGGAHEDLILWCARVEDGQHGAGGFGREGSGPHDRGHGDQPHHNHATEEGQCEFMAREVHGKFMGSSCRSKAGGALLFDRQVDEGRKDGQSNAHPPHQS